MKPCVFPCKVAAAGDERYLVCAAVAAAVVWFVLCVLQQWWFLCSMRFLNLCLQIALEWLHECCMGFVVGEEAGARNVVFFFVKWLQPAMKGTSSVRRVRLGSFRSLNVFCNTGWFLCT